MKTNNNLLKNQKGVALLMVLSSFALVMALIGTVTYSNYLNTLQIYNKTDREQAQINAQSGLELAIGRLILYQEALNILEKNPSRKKMVKPQELNLIWSTPLIFPIPLPSDATLIQKDALQDFEDESFLQGGMQTSIQNISDGININLLRLPELNKDEDENSYNSEDQNPKKDPATIVKERLIELLRKKMDEAREKEEDFEMIYGYNGPEKLISALQYYVNDQGRMQNSNTDLGDVMQFYQDIQPKHAPLTSMSELHLIYPWNDALIKLIENSITVHGNSTIDLNKMNIDTLKMIIHEIRPEDAKDFFAYRDDPEDPHFFQDKNDFIKYFTQRSGIIDQETLQERMNEFESASIRFGPTGSLFRVKSKGIYGRSEYTIEAIIHIPAYIEPPKPPMALLANGQCPRGFEKSQSTDRDNTNSEKPCVEIQKRDEQNRPIPKPIKFLIPRVVELITK